MNERGIPETGAPAAGVLEPTGTPNETILTPPSAEILKQGIKFSIQRQYFRAAEKGEISYLKAWRVMRGVDQVTLAEKAGMTQPEISRAERPGHARKMKGETLLRIARALDIKIEDLLG